jgi:hypothetical protein
MIKLIQILITFGLVVMMGGSASGQLTQDVRDTVAKNLMQLEVTLNCEKCDLRGAELSNKILKKANLNSDTKLFNSVFLN